MDTSFDEALYRLICEDMERSGGVHAPARPWQPVALWPDDDAVQRAPKFDDLLGPWLGPRALSPAPQEIIDRCRVYLRDLDSPAITTAEFDSCISTIGGSEPRLADVRTALEYALIVGHVGGVPTSGIRILEIGGGYGRLAEPFLRLHRGKVHYLLTDAVPASLYWAYTYLSEVLPDSKVGISYLTPDLQVEDWDCLVVPIWKLESFLQDNWDIGINVASMQEMTADQVALCIEFLDRAVLERGILFLSNSRDYVYRHDYSYPTSWRLIFKRNTPLSWSPHYPVEIFEKTASETVTHFNPESGYVREVTHAYRTALDESAARLQDARDRAADRETLLGERLASRESAIQRLRSALEARRESIGRQTQRIDGLRASLEARTAALGRQAERVERLRGSLESLREVRERSEIQHRERTQRLERQMAARDAAIAKLRQRNEQMRVRVGRLRAALEAQAAAIAKLRERNEQIRVRMEALKSAHSGQVGVLKSRIAAHDAVVASLNAMIRDAREALVRKRTQVSPPRHP